MHRFVIVLYCVLFAFVVRMTCVRFFVVCLFDRYAPEMELVKHSIDFSQRDVEGAVEVSLYKVPP